MRLVLASALAVLLGAAAVTGNALAQSKPEFRLGFKALADQIPQVVGEPLEEEHWGANGDSLQRTSQGLMVWRKADNWTAFTNGSRTWINGPLGVQERGNDERFDWEAAPPPPGGPAPAPEPTPEAGAVQWKVYEKAELGFRISVPAAWTEMVAGSGPPDQPAALSPASYFVFGAFDAAPRARGESYGYVLVDKGTVPAGATLQDGVRGKVETLNADPTVVKPVSQRLVTTRSGETGEVRFQIKGVVEGQTQTVEMVWYLFVSGSRAYSVSGMAVGDRAESYVRLFEEIGRDFEILSPSSSTPPPTPAPAGPFTPDMKAMDPQNAGPGATLKQLLLDVDGEWAGSWAWRPRRPVTVYLYADANQMADEALRIGEGWIPADAKPTLVQEEAVSFPVVGVREWAVMLTVKGASWGVPWEQMKARHNLLHEYALVMIYDTGAWDLPIWLVEGIAEYCAFARDPQAISAYGRVTAATALFNMSQLPGANPAMFPSLRQLTPSSWVSMVASGEAGKRSAYGIAYLSVKYLVDRVGTGKIAQVLQAVAAGESFDAALQRLTGYTVEQLDAEYRSTISRAGWTQ